MAARIPTTETPASEDTVKLAALRALMDEALKGTSKQPDLGEHDVAFRSLLAAGFGVRDICNATVLSYDAVVAALVRMAH